MALMGQVPPIVLSAIEEIIAKLDFYYGADKDIDHDMGGYVLLIESSDDYVALQNILHQKLEQVTPEYIKMVSAGEHSYANALVLCSDDDSISLFIPIQLVPDPFQGSFEGGMG